MRVYTVRYREAGDAPAFKVEGRYENLDHAKRAARIKACRPTVSDVKITFMAAGSLTSIPVLALGPGQ